MTKVQTHGANGWASTGQVHLFRGALRSCDDVIGFCSDEPISEGFFNDAFGDRTDQEASDAPCHVMHDGMLKPIHQVKVSQHREETLACKAKECPRCRYSPAHPRPTLLSAPYDKGRFTVPYPQQSALAPIESSTLLSP